MGRSGGQWVPEDGRGLGGDVDATSATTTGGVGGPSFLGSHRHSLDDKRRVAIPKPFRDQVSAEGEAWVICRQLGGDPCLAMYPQAKFEAALQRLESLRDGVGVGSKEIRAYLRHVRMSATTAVPDKQGRIVLGEEQCRLAGIGREVVFVGSGDHAELWAPERLPQGDEEQDFRQLASRLFG